jgi:hypothetical protein
MTLGALGVIETGLKALAIPHGEGGAAAAIGRFARALSA